MGDAVGWFGMIVGAIGGIAGIIATWQKQQLTNKTSELDYLFARYKETVEAVKKEHTEDRAVLAALQSEHLHCREEVSALKERAIAQDAEVAFLRQRIITITGGAIHPPGALPGPTNP